MLDPSLLGRLKFTHTPPTKQPLSPGRNHIGVSEERDYVLYVPQSVDTSRPVPMMAFFHGAGGSPEKVLPFIEEHAEQHGFIVLAGHSIMPTWDIVIGGNGPDLERLEKALALVADHFPLDPQKTAFAGFSDGASYALSIGITNGDIASHVIAFSGGFMSIFMQEGSPKVLIAHGLIDEQLPIDTSGRANAAKLKEAGYDVSFVEFNGLHIIHPPVVTQAIEFFLGTQ